MTICSHNIAKALNGGTQRPNVCKDTRSVSDGYLHALEAYLVNLELPPKNY